MKVIKISERERDFLSGIVEYFQQSDLNNDYTITRKGYKFHKEEMAKLQEILE